MATEELEVVLIRYHDKRGMGTVGAEIIDLAAFDGADIDPSWLQNAAFEARQAVIKYLLALQERELLRKQTASGGPQFAVGDRVAWDDHVGTVTRKEDNGYTVQEDKSGGLWAVHASQLRPLKKLFAAPERPIEPVVIDWHTGEGLNLLARRFRHTCEIIDVDSGQPILWVRRLKVRLNPSTNEPEPGSLAEWVDCYETDPNGGWRFDNTGDPILRRRENVRIRMLRTGEWKEYIESSRNDCGSPRLARSVAKAVVGSLVTGQPAETDPSAEPPPVNPFDPAAKRTARDDQP